MLVTGTPREDILSGIVIEDNILQGGTGDDTLIAYGLDDLMFGGRGRDTFELGSQIGIDIIADFQPSLDLIRIGSIGVGFHPHQGGFDFVEGGRNAAEDDRATVIYNHTNGKLFYDFDGSGNLAAKHLANMSSGLHVDHGDFFVF